MRVLFVSAFDYPTKYAHARHGLEMARAYHARFGSDFLFLVNMAPTLPVPYRRLFGPFGRRIKLMHLRRVLVPLRLGIFFLMNPSWRSVVVASDPVLFSSLARYKKLFGFTLCVECHGQLSPRQAAALERVDLAIFTTTWLKDQYDGKAQKSLIAPNAVDLDAFRAVTDDRDMLRNELNLPRGFLIGYIGRFAPLNVDKGITFLIDAMHDLSDTRLLLVGGSRQEIPPYEAYAKERGVRDRVTFVRHVDASMVPKYAKACDVLAYVPTEKSQFFERETSPMKVYEYMAAKRPIILADTPALREVVAEDAVYFVNPDSPRNFREVVAIIRAGEGEEKVRRAFDRVQSATWKARVETIVQELRRVV